MRALRDLSAETLFVLLICGIMVLVGLVGIGVEWVVGLFR